MTQPKRTAQVARLQQLYTRLNTVAKQIKQEEARHQEQRRHQEMERVMVYGRLVLLAGLDDISPELLLGALQDSRAPLQDAATRQRWQTVGAQLLLRHRRLQRTVRRLWPQSLQADERLTDASVSFPPLPTSARDHTVTENIPKDWHGGRAHDGT